MFKDFSQLVLDAVYSDQQMGAPHDSILRIMLHLQMKDILCQSINVYQNLFAKQVYAIKEREVHVINSLKSYYTATSLKEGLLSLSGKPHQNREPENNIYRQSSIF